MSSKDRFKFISAVYLFFRDGNKILLIRRANTGYMDGMLGVPSGHIDGGEPAIMAAVREAKEEVGVEINPADLRLVHTIHRVAEEGDHERIDLGFEVQKWQGQIINAEPHKCTAVEWFDADNLPDDLIPVIRSILEHVSAGIPYSHTGF